MEIIFYKNKYNNQLNTRKENKNTLKISTICRFKINLKFIQNIKAIPRQFIIIKH